MGRDNKPKGKTTGYAFFVQTCREEFKSKFPHEIFVYADLCKRCSLRWKTMTPQLKAIFQEMSDRDFERYGHEITGYDGADKGKKRKRTKDPNEPKRALSAFFLFCNDERPKIKKTDPRLGIGDVGKELGLRWSSCPPDLKKNYEKQAEKEKEKYLNELSIYKSQKEKGNHAQDREILALRLG